MNLRVSWSDISLYLLSRAEPLAILRAVNLTEERCSWNYVVTADRSGDTILTISRIDGQPIPIDPNLFCSGHIPEIFNSESIAFYCGESAIKSAELSKQRTVANTRSQIEFQEISGDGTHRIVITSYFNGVIPPSLFNFSSIQSYARVST